MSGFEWHFIGRKRGWDYVLPDLHCPFRSVRVFGRVRPRAGTFGLFQVWEARILGALHENKEADVGVGKWAPSAFRRHVELLGDEIGLTTRLECFARTAAPGWTPWGLEAPS